MSGLDWKRLRGLTAREIVAALIRDGFGLDFPPRSGGMGSERHAAARMLIPSMPALASAGVR
jgi:hypothetical protein